MPYAFHTVDVFTDHLHGGNPLAVLPDARGLSEAQMQAITREFNYSETTFVYPPADPAHTRHVRIFTPGGEVPFAVQQPGRDIELATKCDLCLGRPQGPACVQMCPHGSARRVNFKDETQVDALFGG